jgi:hypothetical protein
MVLSFRKLRGKEVKILYSPRYCKHDEIPKYHCENGKVGRVGGLRVRRPAIEIETNCFGGK